MYCDRSSLFSRKLKHPGSVELEAKTVKISNLIEDIFDVANTQVIITSTDTGIADYSINLSFAKSLETLGNDLLTLGGQLKEQAGNIRDRIKSFKERKAANQDIQFVKEIQNSELRTTLGQLQNEMPVGKSASGAVQWQIKKEPPQTQYITDSEDSTQEEMFDASSKKKRKTSVYSGDPDTKFFKPKENQNDSEKHSFKCKFPKCGRIFRNRGEFRNHLSTHRPEFYTCMTCARIFRSYKSFKTHKHGHDQLPINNRYRCGVCDSSFELRSTLTNHMQKHSDEVDKCRICGKEFKWRQNYLDHKRYGHLKKKTVQCPKCKKMFGTKASMFSHKYQKHGPAKDLVPGYSMTPIVE